MPTVYGISLSPFVRKVRVALAEKGLSYDRDPVIPVNPPPEYRQISPLGKIPAYRDGDVTLADSSVICAYLDRIHPDPPLYPSDPYEYARALWFEEYADGGLIQVMGPKVFFERIIAPRFFGRPTNEEVVQKALDEELPIMFDYLESQLESPTALAGTRFSIGDIGIATPFVNFRHAGCAVDAERWPKLARYIEAVHARPSFKALIDEEVAEFGLGTS